jgi:Arc/MetJ-type ribon-helix-helix transcriptional regulator
MTSAKVAVTIDSRLLRKIDRLVAAGEYPSRSGAFQVALQKLADERERERSYLAALELLDPDEEVALAEERLAAEVPWPDASVDSTTPI